MNFHPETATYCVTGCGGMIGQALMKALRSQKRNVVGWDANALDITDAEQVQQAFALIPDPQNTIVVHLAAMSDTVLCQKDPQRARAVNVQGVKNVLDAMMNVGCSRLIFPSTAYVYGSDMCEATGEEDVLNPEGMYAQTKCEAEDLIKQYTRMHSLSAAILRLSNVYGPSLKPNTVIGSLIMLAEKGDRLSVRDGGAVRDFIYIDDVVESVIRISGSLSERKCLVVNVSTQQATSIADLLKMIADMYQTEYDHPPLNQTSRLVLKNDRLGEILNWKPSTSLCEGLDKVRALRKQGVYVKT